MSMADSSRPILVTGAAGFIGAEVALRLLQRGERVIGVDNLNTYYDPALKHARLSRIAERPPADQAWSFEPLSVEDGEALLALFALGGLAAWAGGAAIVPAALRMLIWGAAAMGLTTVVGRLFGPVA